MIADLEIRITTEGVAQDTRLRFELHSPSGALPYTHQPIDGETLLGMRPALYRSRLLKAMEKLDRGQRSDGSPLPPAGVQGELASFGEELYQALFPQSLKAAYWEFRDRVETLSVVSNEPWIPWELIKPWRDEEADDFLCCRFALTRWLVGKAVPAAELGETDLGVARVAVIEGGSVEGERSLPRAKEAGELLKGMAHRHSGVESVRVPDAGYEDVERTLRLGGYGIVHFVGHGWFDENELDLAGFLLADGRTFLPRDLGRAIQARIRQDRPLIFFGSCEAGQQGFSLARLGGWVKKWILDCGCGAFLAPQWSVRDASTAHFAGTFYGALEGGSTVAEAARTARLEVREEFPDATTWAAFAVYAHPQARLRLGLGPTPLRVPEFHWRSEVSPPGALLQAEYGVVPFHGRETEMAGLEEWCADPAPVGVRLYTGPGGMGKTRLALELCHRLRQEEWQVGLLAPDPSRSPKQVWSDLQARQRPTLIVVDYAESRQEILVPLLRELYQVEEGRYRLLLLARDALGWWEKLKRCDGGVGDLLQGPATSLPFLLDALASSMEKRQESYVKAAEAFAERLSRAVPTDLPDDLDHKMYQRVLLIHMRALAQVEGKQLSEREEILEYVLLREERGWGRQAKARGLPEEVVEGIAPAMAAISVGGGAENEDHAIEVLSRLPAFARQERSVLVQVARLLHDSYPGERWIAPLLPDLLGEYLALREFRANKEWMMGMMRRKGSGD